MRRSRSNHPVSVRLAWAGMPRVPERSALDPLALFLCDCCDSFHWANSQRLLQQKQLWKFSFSPEAELLNGVGGEINNNTATK